MTSRRRLVGLIAALGLALVPGCFWCPKRADLSTDCMETCQAIPQCCRGNVYVFLISGIDPFDFAGLADARRNFARLGFTKVYTGQFYHTYEFVREMRGLAATEPDARFVVAGIGTGVEGARSLIESVAADGVTIDVLATIDAPFWSSMPQTRPDNVQRVVSINSEPMWLAVAPGIGEDVTVELDTWTGVVGHPMTVEVLASRLAEIAGTVRVYDETLPVQSDDSTATPRPVVARPERPADRWEFLRPAARLSDPLGDQTSAALNRMRRKPD